MKKVLASVVIFAALVVVAGLVYIYSGAYNVSAKSPDNAVLSWVLRTTRHYSIESRADDMPSPPSLSDENLIRAGARRYGDDCAACHGSPGNYPGPIGKGLNPEPPNLMRGAAHANPRVLYWAVMHGIKMTGMPSWDHEYDADKAWSVVAFLENALPRLSPEQYRQMSGGTEGGEEQERKSASSD